jgi:hypothetical protein
MAAKIGGTAETLRKWVPRSEIDQGLCGGLLELLATAGGRVGAAAQAGFVQHQDVIGQLSLRGDSPAQDPLGVCPILPVGSSAASCPIPRVATAAA